MKRQIITKTTSLFATAGLASSMLLIGGASAAHADTIDRAQERCGNALATVKLERDGREREVDIEVYSNKRGERWRITLSDSDGNVLRKLKRKTNREGEFDVWRTVPSTVDSVTVKIRGPKKNQKCTLELQNSNQNLPVEEDWDDDWDDSWDDD